ncbi:MAG TPA: hypothetical protein VMR95_01690 [Candidatus Binatia bacterium]|nr:hypothetical protein [Candidatus Binatia bacterium]
MSELDKGSIISFTADRPLATKELESIIHFMSGQGLAFREVEGPETSLRKLLEAHLQKTTPTSPGDYVGREHFAAPLSLPARERGRRAALFTDLVLPCRSFRPKGCAYSEMVPLSKGASALGLDVRTRAEMLFPAPPLTAQDCGLSHNERAYEKAGILQERVGQLVVQVSGIINLSQNPDSVLYLDGIGPKQAVLLAAIGTELQKQVTSR